MFEQLPGIYVDGSKHVQDLSVDISNIDVAIMTEGNNEDEEIQLSLSTEELIDGQIAILSIPLC